MEDRSNSRDQRHLINLILTRNSSVPNFALFLGSGASVLSGVRSAMEMVDEWRRELYLRAKTTEPLDRWFGKQDWYMSDDEYAILFELVYDQPSQRRVFIEERIKGARPSWGYVYLTNLLKNRIFDVVFTTNFDDLLNESCYLYSEGLRPIVAAHDSAVSGIRVTSDRPKIIKLHGDFLYDNIKNTLHELETLELNTKRKLIQFAQEYGLVVVGYSGRDRSVMDTLELLLRSEEYFKQGIYWCSRKGETPGRRLQSLLRRDRVYMVEIDGFDEFMAELHEAGTFSLPEPIARPFKAAHDRTRLFVDIPQAIRTHPVIGKHVREVLYELDQSPQQWVDLFPPTLMAAVLRRRGDLENAARYLEKALEEEPEDTRVAYELADILATLRRDEDLKTLVNKALLPNYNKAYFLLRVEDNEGVIKVANDALSADPSDNISRINRAIAFKRLGRFADMDADLKILEESQPLTLLERGYALAAGIAALRGDKPQW